MAPPNDQGPSHGAQHGTRKRTLSEPASGTIDGPARKRLREVSPTQSEKGVGSDDVRCFLYIFTKNLNLQQENEMDQDGLSSNPDIDIGFDVRIFKLVDLG